MAGYTKILSFSSIQMATFVIIAILTERILASPISPKITFYQDKDYKGPNSEQILNSVMGCIPAQPNLEWSSVKVEPVGLCLELFDNIGCQTLETVERIEGSVPHFKENLNDRVLAFKICGS